MLIVRSRYSVPDVYLTCMAVIKGVKSVHEVAKTVKAGLGKVIRVRFPPHLLSAAMARRPGTVPTGELMCAPQITWITSLLYTVFAQQFLPTEMWVPFLNFVPFFRGVAPPRPRLRHFHCTP